MAFVGSFSGAVALKSGVRSVCSVDDSFAVATPARRRDASIRMGLEDIGITMAGLMNGPATVPLGASIGDKDAAVYQAYRQVFGNAYVMESERAEMYKAESMYRCGLIPLKEFVRAMALSETYKRRFFDACGPYRSVELNFKHLLGRGPNSQAEVSEHVRRSMTEGYEADINSFIDSDEYNARFGLECAPFMEFKGTYTTNDEFNRMCLMYSAQGTSDKSLTGRAKALGIPNSNYVLSYEGAGVPSKTASIAPIEGGHPSFVAVSRAIPARPDLGHKNENDALIKLGAPKTSPTAVRRIEVVPGSYMYLTPEEEADYKTSTMAVTQTVWKNELLLAQKKAAVEKLQAEIAALAV